MEHRKKNAIWPLVLTSVWSVSTTSAQSVNFALTNIPINVPSGDIACCIAVGDFNGDGKQDIAVLEAGAFDTSSHNQVLVLLGNGNGTFQKGGAYPVGIASRGLAVGDFNGDGRQDLAVANVSSGDVSILLGNGDGTFQSALSVPAQGGTVNASDSGPFSVAVGDLNGDGKQDLAVLFSQSDEIGVLLGNGDGSFQPLVLYPVDQNPHWLAVADFNGDGTLDLVTANTRGGNVSVLLGNGDGTFRPALNLPAGQRPTRGVVGDFNRDGKLDLAILSTSLGTMNVMLGNGDGTFQSAQQYSLGGNPNSIVTADFDGDGKLDLAVDINSSTMSAPSLVVLRGNGDGSFQPPSQLNMWGSPVKVFDLALGEFDNDQKPDLAIASGLNSSSGNTANLSILLNTTPLAIRGSLAQVASEGTWDFLLDVINLGSSQAEARVSFTGENGTSLALPLTFPQSLSPAGPEVASTLDRALNSNAQIIVESTGPASAPPLIGSGQLLANGNITGFGIFNNLAFGWHAVVPIETRNASKYTLTFDNTTSKAPGTTGVVAAPKSLATGVAVANVAAGAASIPVIIRDDTGAQIGTATIDLPPHGHISFMLSNRYPVTANKRGTIEFQTPPAGQISVLGLRANGPALTTLPVLASSDMPGGTVAHVAYNGGFTSVFYLVNTGATSASFTLSFFDESGNPLSVPLSLPQAATTTTTAALNRTLAAGAMLVAETQATDAGASVAGSAQLTTTGNISGFEIFRWTTFGQEASVPLETRTPSSFVLVFDNTNGLTTGVALSNVSTSAAAVTSHIYDDIGTLLESTSINLPARGHTSFLLPKSYPATANKRGMVEFVVPTGGKISAIGLRAKADGTLTTIPALVK